MTRYSPLMHGVIITCQRLDILKHVACYVEFSSPGKPITIARAKFVDSDVRWTSIPEARQKEGEGVSALIDQYLSRNGLLCVIIMSQTPQGQMELFQ
ncbi:MAG TPA: hypothetical protein VJ765_11475 [Chitinophagaceae bacterium]|nr:hypothetical protein [Chitinophagaceae bacterium]